MLKQFKKINLYALFFKTTKNKIIKISIFSENIYLAIKKSKKILTRILKINKLNFITSIIINKYNSLKAFIFGAWILYKKKYFVISSYLEFIADSIQDCVSQLYFWLESHYHISRKKLLILKIKKLSIEEIMKKHILQYRYTDIKLPIFANKKFNLT
ncbi:60S ribosomal protein L18A (nucleomorph) [Lotharella oceanica]|uniref:60S ribosomal protein L18A n=1 Tax=Lotharella oceanica TaxID=641309 RepID=A0A060D6B6_9EUKA|nr:60S ribosomal protein L18A [Lotharella oceanica]